METREYRQARIDAHRDAQTCSVCGKHLDYADGYYWSTHAHMQCQFPDGHERPQKEGVATAAPPLAPKRPRAHRGRVCRKLADLLQRNFPETNSGLALTWEPENLFPATGSYRTNWTLDCARWEGFARHYRSDGSFYTVLEVYGYTPMSTLIRSKDLTISADGEVGPALSTKVTDAIPCDSRLTTTE